MKFLRNQMNKKRWLVLYGILMIWLLFGRGSVWGHDYWEQVRTNMNLVPLHTIKLYLRVLHENRGLALTRHAIVNLLGNIVMFVPLGVLIPGVSQKFRIAWKFFLLVMLLICVVELIQLFSLVGCCDIDDLILNVFGAGIGFVVFQFLVEE